jgi:hypothetical protein
MTNKRFLLFDPKQSNWCDNSIDESDNVIETKNTKDVNEQNEIFRKNGFKNWKLSLLPVERPISTQGWTCLKTDYPLQKDSINCGVYVVLILSGLMDGKHEERVTFDNSAADLCQHRKEIYSTLEESATYK